MSEITGDKGEKKYRDVDLNHISRVSRIICIDGVFQGETIGKEYRKKNQA